MREARGIGQGMRRQHAAVGGGDRGSARTDLDALAATFGLRAMTMLNLLLRFTRTLPAAFFFLAGAAFILRGALLRPNKLAKGPADLPADDFAASVAAAGAAGLAAAAGAAGVGGVPALGPRAAKVRVAIARTNGSARTAGAAATKARKACMLTVPLCSKCLLSLFNVPAQGVFCGCCIIYMHRRHRRNHSTASRGASTARRRQQHCAAATRSSSSTDCPREHLAEQQQRPSPPSSLSSAYHQRPQASPTHMNKRDGHRPTAAYGLEGIITGIRFGICEFWHVTSGGCEPSLGRSENRKRRLKS